jgi:N-methylhydantoinase B/oxoprolinase/acetone carboxylase alpha subunit
VGLFMTERTRFAAPGLAGGGAGGIGRVTINGEPVDTHRQHVLRAGDRVRLSTPGGGGYGAPEERDPGEAATDRARGYVD